MSIEQKIREAQESLSDNVSRVINKVHKLSKEQGRPIADGIFDDHFVVSDLFDMVTIDSAISEAICLAMKASNASKTLVKAFEIAPDDASIGWLIRNSKSVLKAQKVVLMTVDYFKIRRNDDDLIYTFEKNAEIDYLKSLHFHLNSIRNLVTSSKKIKRKTVSHVSDFCDLCWRLANKRDVIDASGYDGDSSGNKFYSMRYCLEHHPQRSATKYYHDRRVFIRIFESLDDEFKKSVIRLEGDDKISLHHIINKFALRTHIKKLNEYSWKECACIILEISKKNYARAYDKIHNVSIENQSSWKGWFLAVIKSLDDSSSKNDLLNWENTCIAWKDKLDERDLTKGLIGGHVLLNVLRRYEAVSKINEREQQGNSVKNITPRKEKIIELVNEQKKKNKKINVSKISVQLKISRTYVYDVIKEFDLR